MSTRANIILNDGGRQIIFYRHSDGYPEGTLPSLNKFVEWLKEGKIRNNLSQASGWLILLGAMEYGSIPAHKQTVHGDPSNSKDYCYTEGDLDSIGQPIGWKCGAYEITDGIHGDIEFLYTIDLKGKTVSYKAV